MEKLSQEQIEEFREAFNLFDANSDGSITTKELGHVMRSLNKNPTEAEIQDMIYEVDADGDGTIDFQEFLVLAASKMTERYSDGQLKDAFKAFDKDNTGTFGLAEIHHVLTNLGADLSMEEMQEILREVDVDGDNAVSFKEFSMLMRQ